ncbi:hypothetical protein KIN20_027535 [Parelaphostrongylus tenuis]|uniref:Uncharacterized protein n=1 Tax=Parelaphostrongylus tenuis TaxID=148309 RepID=A0AAD5QZV1_PARTN|nr:hypothetical protein KIN20_027535 [Parelaphostrongylus tenuis]
MNNTVDSTMPTSDEGHRGNIKLNSVVGVIQANDNRQSIALNGYHDDSFTIRLM